MITFNRALTLLVSAAGMGLFLWFGWPLPFLLGPMAACLMCAISSLPLQGMGLLGKYMRTFLGVAIGTSITPEIVGQFKEFAFSLALIPVLILLLALVGFRLFRFLGFSKQTSLYAAMPGGLQEMLMLGEEAGGNVRAMSLIHATRVLALFSLVPLAVTLLWGVDFSNPPGKPASTLPPLEIMLMIVSGFVGWRVAVLLRIPGPSLLGPAILSMVFSLTGIINSRPPTEIMVVAQFFIGLEVGVRYTGITPGEIRRFVFAGVLYSMVTAAFSLAFVFLVLSVLPVSPIDALFAFLPGGQAEMTIMAIVAGADVAFVIAHHFLRIMVVLLFAQILSGWLKRR